MKISLAALPKWRLLRHSSEVMVSAMKTTVKYTRLQSVLIQSTDTTNKPLHLECVAHVTLGTNINKLNHSAPHSIITAKKFSKQSNLMSTIGGLLRPR